MKHRSKAVYLLIPLLLIMVALFLLSGVKLLESVLLPSVNVPEQIATRTIVKDGISYYPRQDITVILLIGTDESGPVLNSGSYNNKASADMVSLLVLDSSIQTCTLVSLDRDTMMDIPVLGLKGKYAGSVYAQLATSHNYGSGLEDSCENTKKAVSDFLYGLTVDYCFCMSMGGIRVLNDAVGGVEVTVREDFSAVDPTLVMGETLRLSGDQAYHYVHSRMGVGSQLNTSRMSRQKEYMTGFVYALRESYHKDPLFLTDLWDEISPYVVTDCSTVSLNHLVTQYIDYDLVRTLSPRGESIQGEKYQEFYADPEALSSLIIELFYQVK